MTKRWTWSSALTLVAMAAGCSSPRAAAPVTDNRGGGERGDAAVAPSAIDWAAVARMEASEADEVWLALDVRGDTLAAVLGRVEAEGAAVVEAMAAAAVDGYLSGDHDAGGCVATTEYVDPHEVGEDFVPEVQPGDDLGSPCLRRALQLWALRVLPVARLQGDLRDELISIAGSYPPEDELIRAGFARVTDEALLLEMLAAAKKVEQHELADQVAVRLSEAGRATAAVTLAIDGALLALDAATAPDVYLDTLAAGEVRAETQLVAIERLTAVAAADDRKGAVRARIVAGLAAVRVGRDCRVEAAAIDAHAGLTGTGFPLDLPAEATPEAYVALLCRAVTSKLDTTALWRKLIPARGLVVETYDALRITALWHRYNFEAPDANDDGAPDVPEADADGNGDPFTEVVTVRVPRRGRIKLPHADRLPRMLARCDDATACYDPDDNGIQASFELAPAPHGRRQLTRIRWRLEENYEH